MLFLRHHRTRGSEEEEEEEDGEQVSGGAHQRRFFLGICVVLATKRRQFDWAQTMPVSDHR
jgi:hypothetical protein